MRFIKSLVLNLEGRNQVRNARLILNNFTSISANADNAHQISATNSFLNKQIHLSNTENEMEKYQDKHITTFHTRITVGAMKNRG